MGAGTVCYTDSSGETCLGFETSAFRYRPRGLDVQQRLLSAASQVRFLGGVRNRLYVVDRILPLDVHTAVVVTHLPAIDSFRRKVPPDL